MKGNEAPGEIFVVESQLFWHFYVVWRRRRCRLITDEIDGRRHNATA